MGWKWRVKEFEELSHYLPGATEQNQGSPHHDSRPSGRDSISGLIECKQRTSVTRNFGVWGTFPCYLFFGWKCVFKYQYRSVNQHPENLSKLSYSTVTRGHVVLVVLSTSYFITKEATYEVVGSLHQGSGAEKLPAGGRSPPGKRHRKLSQTFKSSTSYF